MTTITKLTPKEQQAVLNWPEQNDVPIFPADTRNKEIKIYNWQNFDFSKTNFRSKLANSEYDNGIAIRLGKTLSGKYYAVAFDFDGWDAVVEWFGNWKNVMSLSKKTMVEWHQDKGKLHVIFLSRTSFQNRKIHIKNAFLEIRCERNALFASPSIHKEGKPYAPLGNTRLALIEQSKELALKSKIDIVCKNYMSDEDKQKYDEWLDLPTTILGENQGRHDATKFKVNRYYWKYSGEWLNLSDDQRFERAWEWHLVHCKPPRSRQEFDNLCKWAINAFRLKRDELHERVRAERQQWNNNTNEKKDCKQADKKQTTSNAKKYISYKYTGKDKLYEEIRLGGKSTFLTLNENGEPKTVDEIDQSEERNMIIKPHSTIGLLPTIPYKFKDMEEIEDFIELAKRVYIDDLYYLVKSIILDLVSTKEKELIVLLSADTIHSYFQEKFITVHYLKLTGPPGWGKGAILLTFKLLGYRVVLAGDMSGPNLLDILGPMEKCQVTILEDEFDNIHEDPDKERIIKMGYEDVGLVTRTIDPSSSDRDIRYYNPFGIKIFASEQSLEQKRLGGLNDRTFNVEVTKGRPKFLVKEIKKQMELPVEKRLQKYRKIIERIEFLRKLLLSYKLIHHADSIEEINTNINSRALELCGPALRLFNSPQLVKGNHKVRDEIKDAFSHFLRKKGELDKKTIEVVLYGVIKKLIEQIDAGLIDKTLGRKNIESKLDGDFTNYIMTYDLICNSVMTEVEGIQVTNRSFDSADYGKTTHDFLLQRCRDIFKAANFRISEGKKEKRALRFNKEETYEAGSNFEIVSDIEIYDEVQDGELLEDQEVTDMWNDISGNGSDGGYRTNVQFSEHMGKNRENGTLDRPNDKPEHENEHEISNQSYQNSENGLLPGNKEKIVHLYGDDKDIAEMLEDNDKIANDIQTRAAIDLIDLQKQEREIYPVYEGSDIHKCTNCNLKGDRWEMKDHKCGKLKK